MSMIQIEKLARALQELAPNSFFKLNGDTYSDIEWLDDDVVQPTEDAVNAKITEIESLEPMEELRRVRNKKLTQTDWWVLPDRTATAEQTAYRQALRDITDTYSSLDTVVWPTKP